MPPKKDSNSPTSKASAKEKAAEKKKASTDLTSENVGAFRPLLARSVMTSEEIQGGPAPVVQGLQETPGVPHAPESPRASTPLLQVSPVIQHPPGTPEAPAPRSPRAPQALQPIAEPPAQAEARPAMEEPAVPSVGGVATDNALAQLLNQQGNKEVVWRQIIQQAEQCGRVNMQGHPTNEAVLPRPIAVPSQWMPNLNMMSAPAIHSSAHPASQPVAEYPFGSSGAVCVGGGGGSIRGRKRPSGDPLAAKLASIRAIEKAIDDAADNIIAKQSKLLAQLNDHSKKLDDTVEQYGFMEELPIEEYNEEVGDDGGSGVEAENNDVEVD